MRLNARDKSEIEKFRVIPEKLCKNGVTVNIFCGSGRKTGRQAKNMTSFQTKMSPYKQLEIWLCRFAGTNPPKNEKEMHEGAVMINLEIDRMMLRGRHCLWWSEERGLLILSSCLSVDVAVVDSLMNMPWNSLEIKSVSDQNDHVTL